MVAEDRSAYGARGYAGLRDVVGEAGNGSICPQRSFPVKADNCMTAAAAEEEEDLTGEIGCRSEWVHPYPVV